MSHNQACSRPGVRRTAPIVLSATRKIAPPFRYCPHLRWIVDAHTGEPIQVPCGRPRCSLECRDRWARKMAACLRQSFQELPPTHEVRVTVLAGISDGELSKAISRFLRRLCYRLRKPGLRCQYFAINEWSEGQRHVHILLRVDADVTRPLVREFWEKTLPRMRFTCHCERVRNPTGIANYIVKHLQDDSKKEPAPETFTSRLYSYSRRFFTRPVAALWKQQLRDWYPESEPTNSKETIMAFEQQNPITAEVRQASPATRGTKYRIGDKEYTILFPDLLRPLTESERLRLRASILEIGIKQPLCIDEDGGVIDGGHRLIVAEELRLAEIPTLVEPGLSVDEKRALALALNVDRRHLSREEQAAARQERIEKVVELRQERMSTRSIAEQVGVSQKQVRDDLKEAQVSTPTHLIGQDGKIYTSPKPTIFCRNCRIFGAKENCKECKRFRAERGSSTASDKQSRQPKREPGDDTQDNRFLVTMHRCRDQLLKKAAEMFSLLEVSKHSIDTLVAKITDPMDFFSKLAHAKERPAPPPRPAKCEYCGADILWVKTEKGKNMKLNREPGGGSFDIINNVAVSVEWTEENGRSLYRNHFLSCRGPSEDVTEEGEAEAVK